MEMKTAEEVLKIMIGFLLEYLDDLYEYNRFYQSHAFQYGQKVAYLDCLIMIKMWEKAIENGLNFDLEKTYPV